MVPAEKPLEKTTKITFFSSSTSLPSLDPMIPPCYTRPAFKDLFIFDVAL